eukprot:TRINITY_DN3752_c0_g2_i2.p1 TRINITY_DN3752_c0_g2~~TRINITY_DN3752_c0_g2_i2.p1  ORF type:complete len:177 (+),score=11.35 TRINITY_DN3752_c0_g2_i2:176-706(+)
MGTEILFWEDTYLFGCESKVVDLNVQEGAIIVTLDRTICYAASGGQPSDEGKIEVEKEIEHENVDKTLMIKELHWSGNNILHSCEVRDPIIAKILAVGDKVKVSINPEKRILHARLHSAGHLIDAALENIGMKQWYQRRVLFFFFFFFFFLHFLQFISCTNKYLLYRIRYFDFFFI